MLLRKSGSRAAPRGRSGVFSAGAISYASEQDHLGGGSVGGRSKLGEWLFAAAFIWAEGEVRPPNLIRIPSTQPVPPMKSRLILLAAALLLSLGSAVFTGCAGTSTRESTGEYIDSSAVTARVKSALAADEFVRARDVQVETYRGTVQLSGFVDSEAQKDRATDIARSVAGVESVKNNLIVKE